MSECFEYSEFSEYSEISEFSEFSGHLQNLSQGLHDEGPFVHERVGKRQLGLAQMQVVVEQDIDVDGTVLVDGQQ